MTHEKVSLPHYTDSTQRGKLYFDLPLKFELKKVPRPGKRGSSRLSDEVASQTKNEYYDFVLFWNDQVFLVSQTRSLE